MPRNLSRHFSRFLSILLRSAAGLSFLAHWRNPDEDMATVGWAIIAVIVINAVFAFVQEYKAEQTFAALRRLLPNKAWIIHNGQPVEIERRPIVPGDMLILEEGERVPADAHSPPLSWQATSQKSSRFWDTASLVGRWR